jgi:hypothetical protein
MPDPVDRRLDGEVQVVDRDVFVPDGDVPGEFVTPPLDLPQELRVDLRGAALAPRLLGVAIERPFEDGFLREDRPELVEFREKLVVREVQDPPNGGLVALLGPRARVVDREFLEV